MSVSPATYNMYYTCNMQGEGLVTVDAAVARLENANVQLKRQMELR